MQCEHEQFVKINFSKSMKINQRSAMVWGACIKENVLNLRTVTFCSFNYPDYYRPLPNPGVALSSFEKQRLPPPGGAD